MGKLQGYNRLTDGFSRTLTNSETSRGYIFVSNDKKVKKLRELEVFVNKKKFASKRVDNSGRISLGQNLTQDIGKKGLRFKLESEKLFLEY